MQNAKILNKTQIKIQFETIIVLILKPIKFCYDRLKSNIEKQDSSNGEIRLTSLLLFTRGERGDSNCVLIRALLKVNQRSRVAK